MIALSRLFSVNGDEIHGRKHAHLSKAKLLLDLISAWCIAGEVALHRRPKRCLGFVCLGSKLLLRYGQRR